MTRKSNAMRLRDAVLVAAALVGCASGAWAHGQHGNAQHPAPAPRAPAPRPQPKPQGHPQNPPNRNQGQQRPGNAPQGYLGARPQNVPQGYPGARPAPGYPSNAVRPAYPGAYPNSAWGARTGPGAAPAGHLGSWLNDHRNVPVQDQDRMLRSDPSFNRLSPNDQQRLLRQLHTVNQLPDAERQRRLARNETIEQLSPQQRMQANMAVRRWGALPADRQAMMRHAFNDLRSVPPDQRATVLGSARYQNMFSPEERGMLTDVLRAEPYSAPRP